MKTLLRKSKLALSVLLLLGVIFAFVFASNSNVVKAEDVLHEEELYKLSYSNNEIKLLLSTDFSEYLDITKADLSTFKHALKDVIINAIIDDIDLSKYGEDKKTKIMGKLGAPTPYDFGDVVDTSILTNIMNTQLGSVEYINNNFLDGNTFDILIEYYIDNYSNGFVESNPSENKSDVLDTIKTQLVTSISAKVAQEYDNASIEQAEKEAALNAVNTKVTNLVNEVKSLAAQEKSVEVTLGDVKDIINTVEINQDVVNYVKSSGVKENVNAIIMASSDEEITTFFTDVETDVLIDLVKETDIVNADNINEIFNTVGVDNVITIAENFGVDKLADLATAAKLDKDTLTETINNNINQITAKELIRIMKGIYIGENLIYSKDNGFSVTGIKHFIGSLPRPSEIQNWTDEQMKITWNVKITTTFGDIDNALTVGFFGDCNKVRRLAQLLADHVNLYNDNGTYTLELLAPAKSGEALTKFLNNDYISDELKQRIFDDLGLTVDELYNKFNNTTINEYIDLLKQVDYKALFNKLLDGETLSYYTGMSISDSQIDSVIDFAIKVARKFEDKTYADILAFLDDYIDVSALENEKLESLFNYAIKALNKIDDGTLSSAKIREWLNSETSTNQSVYTRIDKLANYESYFDKLKSYVTRVYDRLPERYKEKTITEYYVATSTLDASANINVTKAIELLPQKVEEAIDVFFDGIPERVSVRFVLNVPDIYKITYVYGTESKIGFLPAGAILNEYPNVEKVNNVLLQGWADENGDPITVMPERDLVVTAIAEFSAVAGDDVERDYDPDVTNTLSVTVIPATGTYTYQWYKDGVALTGATSSTIEVTNVKDSGTYYCVVTNEYSDTTTSNNVTVVINKAKIDVSGIYWEQNVSIPYDGTQHTLPLHGTIDSKLSYKRSKYSLTPAGQYTAHIEFTVKDDYKDNYEVVGTVEDTPWEITKITIDVSNYKWPDTKSYVYTGSSITHRLVSEINPLIKATYKSSKEGMYYTSYTSVAQLTASVTFAAAKSNAVDSIIITGSVADDHWEITPMIIDVSGYEWSTTTQFVYDGTEKSVAITTTPHEKFTISYENNASTNAGDFNAKATITSSTKNIQPSVATLEKAWSIAKANYDMNGAYWKTKTYIYNGSEQTIEVVGLPAGVTVSKYIDNAKTDAGTYIAKVELAYDTVNYNAPSLPEKNWEIKKADYDMSTAKWNYSTTIVYNGSEQKIEVIGLPTGVTVNQYTDNAKTNAGFYTAKVTFNYDTKNYNEPKLDDELWEIKKADYDLSNITWSYTAPFTYNKNEQSVTLTNLPEGLVANYVDNAKTNAGSYKAVASFALASGNTNYNIPANVSIDWEIKPMQIDVSAYVWKEVSSFDYDGKEHKVELASAINEMLEVHYINNAKIEIGTYTAKVNYMLKQEAGNNYEIIGETPTFEWSIKKVIIPEPEKIYNYDPLIVDGVAVLYVTSVKGTDAVYKLNMSVYNTLDLEKTYEIDGQTYKVQEAYDIHFEKDSKKEQVAGEFEVKMLIPEELKNKTNLGIMHISDNDEVTLVKANVNGEFIEFETDGFSVYVLVEMREKISLIVIIAVAVLALILLIAIICYFARKKEDEDGNIDPFFIKLASCSPEIKSCYYQLKAIVKAYEDRINCVINAYIESFDNNGESLASIEVKNAKLVVRAANKKVVVKDTMSLNNGKNLLKKAFKNADFTK